MVKKILISLVVLIVAVLAYASTRPDDFSVRRDATIKAPPERVYALLSDFSAKGWGSWSPWEKLDPDLKRTFGGAPAGKGATYAWQGNDKVGAGRMEIIEDTPPSKLAIKLDFLRPFEASNRAEFTLVPAGDSTKVDWVMTGKNNFVGKVMQVFFDMDKLVGKDFETGLANLKGQAEKP